MREFFKRQKADNYPIENYLLIPMDEYCKSLYMKLLCAIIHYSDDTDEMQVMYLQRIIKGSGFEEKIEDYMRKALDISQTDIEEFLNVYKDNPLRLTFAIDGMLLLSVVEVTKEKQYEFLAEVIEMLGIKKDELEYLSQVAISILKQDSVAYDSAKTILPNRLVDLNLSFYIKDFYVGAIIDNNEEKHFFANELLELNTFRGSSNALFKERKITFENLILSIESNWRFEGCEEVSFINCSITGKTNIFEFESIGKVLFKKCSIRGFKNRIGHLKSVNEFCLYDNKINECGFTCSGDKRGGAWLIAGQSWNLLDFQRNVFLNCFIAADTYRGNYGVTGAILSGVDYILIKKFVLKNNKFIGSVCKNNGNYVAAQITHISGNNKEVEGNECTGELQRIFE